MNRQSDNSNGVREWREPDGTKVSIFTEGDALFDAMIADFEAARSRIWLESYIFNEDDVGRRLLAVLETRSREGIDVRVRVDAIGSRFGFSGTAARRLHDSPLRFHWCHPWQWKRPWLFHRRNHRKLVVIDDVAAYLGGFNIDASSSRLASGAYRWRDTHVRLEGEIVDDAAKAYRSFDTGDLDWQCRQHVHLQLLTNHGRHCRYRLHCAYRDRLGSATFRIWLTTPYFVPDRATQRRLCQAARRGVDVRILLPGKSDVNLVRWAARAAYSELLSAGVKIFEYTNRMLHAKTLLVDQDWSTIGTANFDYRSFFINYELNLLAESEQMNASLANIFEQDLRDSREITLKPWLRRPLIDRLAELIGWGARKWL